ncbi:MAG: extracellular solute-binding protein [Clostridia bacterium]|nr:extracellular solute-binding protein [Clostridia bacterium]
MKKLVSLILAVLMMLSMMSFATAEEPFELTVMLPDFYSTEDFQTEGNPVLDAIEAATGVRLKVNFVANSTYGDAINTTLADKNQPMVIALTDARGASIIDSARAGAFWDLTDYVKDAENYPYLAAGSENVYNNISVDGRVYGIYRGRAYPRAGIYYRSDIAKEAGIDKEPETIEELTALAEALAAYGKEHDAYALNMVNYTDGTINIITVAYGAPDTWGINEEGNVYPAHEDPAYLQGLNWLRHLYEIGGIDPNFPTIDSTNWDNIERTGKAYMRFDCLDNTYRQQEWFETNEGITDQIFDMIPGLKKEDGSVSIWAQNPGFSGEIVITKAVSEADLPKVVKFLDWCNGPEGQMLLNWGVQDVTYWVDADGYRLAAPESGEDVTAQIHLIQHSLNQLGMNVPGDLCTPAKLTALREEYETFNKEYASLAVSNPCYPLISETNVAFGTVLKQIISDAAVQYIAGKIDEAGLRAAWQQWSEEGGAIMTEEYNAAYHAALGE